MWRALYLSFYSKDFYRDVAQNWRGLSLSYLFLLMLLYCIPLTLTITQVFRAYVDVQGEALIEKMPVMTFKSGTLSINAPEPYVIYGNDKHKDTGKPKEMIIFDHTGKYKMENLFSGQVLLTDHFVHIRKQSGEIQSVPFEKVPDTVIDHATLHDYANVSKRWFMPFFYISILLTFFIMRIIQVLIYGVFGLLFNRMMGAFLDYPQLVRLSVIALTPVLVIDTLLIIAAPAQSSWPWLGFFLAMGYLIFGIRANRELIT